MTNSHVRRQLLELQHFVLRPQSADTRIDVYSQMITRCLTEHGKDELKLSYDAILYHLEKDYHFEEIPKTLIDTALEKLHKDHDVKIEKSFIILSQNKVDEINKNIHEIEKLRETVLNELQEKICSTLADLSKSKIDSVLENFEDYLSSTFQRYGLDLAKILMDENKSNKLVKGLVSPQNYLDAMMQIVPENKRAGLDKIFNDFFFNPSNDLSKYLYALAQSYIILQVLNINPDLKKIQEVAWNKKTIYLDTNVLFPLLLEGDEKHPSILPLIENTIRLGAKVIVSETTVQEFINRLLAFKKKNSTHAISRKLSLAQGIDHSDNLLKSYLFERRIYSGLSIENFCLKYENYEILLDKLGIIVEDDFTKSIENHSFIEDLIDELKFNSYRKSDFTAFHDAYHILKIKGLRKTSVGDEIGPAFWFLTEDHSLSKSERRIFGESNVFSSIMTDVWVHFISNFLSPKMTVEVGSKAFTKLLSSTFTSHKIKSSDLNNLMTIFMNDDKFTDSELRLIIGDKFAKDILRKIKDVLDSGEEIPQNMTNQLVSRVKDVITDEFTKKRTEDIKLHEKERKEDKIIHKAEIANLESKLNTLNDKLGGIKLASASAENKYSKLKITLIIVLISGVIDAILSLISSNFFRISIVSWILLALLGGEVIIILTLLLRHRIKSKEKIPWSRSEKLGIVGIVVGIISSTLAGIALYYVFYDVPKMIPL